MNEDLNKTPEPPRGSGFGSFLFRGIWLAAQLTLVAGAGYLSFEWLMRSIVHSRKEVAVPDLKGQTLRQAVALLSKNQLALSQVGEEHSPDVAVGTIVKQYPMPGSKVREGKIVSVVTSIGSEKISVPDLAGMALRKAEIEIKSVQLALGETNEAFSVQQPRGHVIHQEPKALSLAEKGDLVHLTISLGEPPSGKLIIPDFEGSLLGKAEAWAQENQVTLQVSEDWSAPEGSDGKIIKQNLKPDTLYDKDSVEEAGLKLVLTVSRRAVSSGQQPGRYFSYKVPEKPARKRELVLKVLSKGAEREIFKTLAQPGENVKIPLAADLKKIRGRIYLDGIFTEEKFIE